jgi:hypothetical protein
MTGSHRSVRAIRRPSVAMKRNRTRAGDHDVEAEERPDASREQFLAEKRNLQSVFHDPRHEFPVGQYRADDTEDEISVAQSHEIF